MKPLTDTHAWKALEQHALSIKFYSHQDFLTAEPYRQSDFELELSELRLNYAHQRITAETLSLLLELAKDQSLDEKIQALFRGDIVNVSEQKPALHTALRAPKNAQIFMKGEDIIPKIQNTLSEVKEICHLIHQGQWLGASGEPITHIVNIGMGGSDLGAKFTHDALRQFHHSNLSYHFISDACPIALQNLLKTLPSSQTLFIVSSKSMTTPETLENFKECLNWMGGICHLEQHFIAVTANKKQAQTLGFKHILPIWDWIGGRFSVFSAVNLITAIAIGYENFQKLLQGAEALDTHFREAPLAKNMPVIMALIGIWNNNFNHMNNLLQLTYGSPLNLWTPFLQQLEMESNGKAFDTSGCSINYATNPIVWGGPGNQAQHSYYQLVAQGTHQIAIDMISIESLNQSLLNQSCDAKRKVLSEGVVSPGQLTGFIPGNIPMSDLRLKNITPQAIGALIALYEHKVYIQSLIWQINAFDQPGVESAKTYIRTATMLC